MPLSVAADALVHGSTGAGNDQVRFDAAFRVLAPATAILAPIRQQRISRDAETAWLAERGIAVPAKTSKYSVNRGPLGGHDRRPGDAQQRGRAAGGGLPVDACRPRSAPPSRSACGSISNAACPSGWTARRWQPVALVERLAARRRRHGVGRGMHVGDTILGIKGRVAFEAPAAVTLIAAHRELEKLVLSRQQLFWKATLGDLYGAMLHEARFFDPLMRDLEAFLESSQQRVSGSVTVRLFQGQATVEGATSPYSLMDRRLAVYGEESSLWSGDEAAAFSKIYGLADVLVGRAAKRAMKAAKHDELRRNTSFISGDLHAAMG